MGSIFKLIYLKPCYNMTCQMNQFRQRFTCSPLDDDLVFNATFNITSYQDDDGVVIKGCVQ